MERLYPVTNIRGEELLGLLRHLHDRGFAHGDINPLTQITIPSKPSNKKVKLEERSARMPASSYS
jgi:hypothetical protein